MWVLAALEACCHSCTYWPYFGYFDILWLSSVMVYTFGMDASSAHKVIECAIFIRWPLSCHHGDPILMGFNAMSFTLLSVRGCFASHPTKAPKAPVNPRHVCHGMATNARWCMSTFYFAHPRLYTCIPVYPNLHLRIPPTPLPPCLF